MRDAKITLVVFDLDGTLVDAYDAIRRSFNATMRAFGYPDRSERVIRRAVGWGDRNLLAPFASHSELDEMLSYYRKHHAQTLVHNSRLFPRVKWLLARLRKKGVKLAVATNRPTRFSRILIRHLGIADYFDLVVCADKLRYRKPHPQILNTIMRRLKVSPDRTLFVGDMFIDAQTGRRAGVRTAMVTTGSSSRRELLHEKPWRVISRIAQVDSLLS